MAEGRGIVRSLSSVLLLGGTALGLYNVYADNSEVLALAQKAACGDRPCTTKTLRESRSPLAQNYTLQTELTEQGKGRRGASVDVECKRAFYLFGAYSCVAQGTLP